ncbi:hypothetical protein [Chryseobacterium sp. POE27]|uniref:hypothetical protein n=1 Tax=Chryseobacterium sp. POE27 TaxID=3138177 RepID=UPI00321BBB4E
MKINYSDLKNKMTEMTGLLFTQPDIQKEEATEIWIKFRQYGYYIYINFEQPFPQKINTEKLIGAGNSLNCSEYKKDNELTQYSKTSEVNKILDLSMSFKGNNSDTVQKIKDLLNNINTPFLY